LKLSGQAGKRAGFKRARLSQARHTAAFSSHKNESLVLSEQDGAKNAPIAAHA
jgi:hypothetical protein